MFLSFYLLSIILDYVVFFSKKFRGEQSCGDILNTSNETIFECNNILSFNFSANLIIVLSLIKGFYTFFEVIKLYNKVLQVLKNIKKIFF